MSTKTEVVVNNLIPDEQFAANVAWWLAQGVSPPPYGTDNGVLFALDDNGAPSNYRMQSFIREWAAFEYAPAQTLLAKIAAKRLSL